MSIVPLSTKLKTLLNDLQWDLHRFPSWYVVLLTLWHSCCFLEKIVVCDGGHAGLRVIADKLDSNGKCKKPSHNRMSLAHQNISCPRCLRDTSTSVRESHFEYIYELAFFCCCKHCLTIFQIELWPCKSTKFAPEHKILQSTPLQKVIPVDKFST